MSTRTPFAVAAFFLACAACSGSSSNPPGGADGGGGGGGNGDGGNGGGGSGGSSSCPASVPAAGTTCSSEALQCEYGGDQDPGCDTYVTCGASGWTVTQTPAPSGCPTPTGGSDGCPSSYSAVTVGSNCGTTVIDCAYPQGRCACTAPAGPALGPGSQLSWVCEQPASGCPEPRPAIGSACTTEQLSCNYGACALPNGTSLLCEDGSWHTQAVACPD